MEGVIFHLQLLCSPQSLHALFAVGGTVDLLLLPGASTAAVADSTPAVVVDGVVASVVGYSDVVAVAVCDEDGTACLLLHSSGVAVPWGIEEEAEGFLEAVAVA